MIKGKTYRKDRTGEKFGRLTIILERGRDEKGTYLCDAQCECGVIKTYRMQRLLSGETKSCGCLHKEIVANKCRTHGLSDSTEYSIWVNMRVRCANPTQKWYGANGIKVCARWQNSFENFYADMGPRPSIKHTLDRFPNQKGHYEPGNCRWATPDEQANNRTSNVWLTADGMTKTQKQWAEYFGVGGTAISWHLLRGVPFEEVYEFHKSKQNEINNGIERKRCRRRVSR